MTLILGLPIRIEAITNIHNSRHIYKLRAMRIGENLVLGNSYRDGLYDTKLYVEDIPQKRIAEFLEGGTSRIIVNQLIDMLFPADMKVEIILKGIPQRIRLTNQNCSEERSFLGINSRL